MGEAVAETVSAPSAPRLQRSVLISLRFLTLLVIATFLLFNRPSAARDSQVVLLLSVFLVSVLLMLFISRNGLEKKSVLFSVFLLDTFFVSYGLYLSGSRQWDLIILYFLTIFIAALTRDVASSIGVGLISCFVFAFLQYRLTGRWFEMETSTLLKMPFLFIVSTFSGYIASESRAREDQSRKFHEMNAIIAQQADVATQKLRETIRQVNALLEYHRRILASIQTGVVVCHRDQKVKTFNEEASRITALAPSEVEGKSLEELPPQLAPMRALMERTLREGRAFTQENVEIRLPRGDSIVISLQTSVLSGSDGSVLGVIATLKDMSLIKQMELQLLRNERLSALGEMAAGVAHEIKNPLNAIQGFAARLAQKMEDPSHKKYAEIIVEESKRMDTIINDVLEYNRTRKPEKRETDLHALLEEVLAFMPAKLEKSGVTLARELDPELPRVAVDPDKMKQVFLNLMINAIHAMPQGGTLTIRTRREEGMIPADRVEDAEAFLLQQVFLQQKMVSVTIQDTGCGIPKENIPRLFHPFYTTKTTGTGLGLSICHKLVEAHGGFIRVDSTVGVGSSFTVYLPLEEQ